MLLEKLASQKLITPPKWLPNGTQYLCQMGSVAYGVSGQSSDIDVYGYCLPPIEMTFPHLTGEIFGFGTQSERFRVWQQHHVNTHDGNKEYDFAIYSLVNFFDLCMDNNPNMLDALFVPDRCILYSTDLSKHVRKNRKLFLHKGSFNKLKNYSYSMLKKLRNKPLNKFAKFCKTKNIPLSVTLDEVRAEIKKQTDKRSNS